MSLKKTIEQAVLSEEQTIFTEDLKNLVYLTQTNKDFELLMNAIKKYFAYLIKLSFRSKTKLLTIRYSKQGNQIVKFNFEAPIMRLSCLLGKSNEMLQMYLQEVCFTHSYLKKIKIKIINFKEKNFLHDSYTPATLLMAKLYEEGKYDDVIKVFRKLLVVKDNFSKNSQEDKKENKHFLPYDCTQIAADTLLAKVRNLNDS